jgi:hypothetical protein
MSSRRAYPQHPQPAPSSSSLSLGQAGYSRLNDSRASFSTVDSYTPLTNARKPEKDWEAAFGELQAKYGTMGLPPKAEKRPKTSEGDKPKSSSFSSFLGSGRKREEASVRTRGAGRGAGLDAVEEESADAGATPSLDPRKVRSAVDPRSAYLASESSLSATDTPSDSNPEARKSKFAAVKSLVRPSFGRKSSSKGQKR